MTTQAGDLELAIPKLRAGGFFPSLLERRRRIDQALYAVIMEAYVHGVSTRSVDDLVKALGSDTGISKSEVSRICADLDALDPPAGPHPVPLPVSRRHLRQGPRRPPHRLPGDRHRHRRECRQLAPLRGMAQIQRTRYPVERIAP